MFARESDCILCDNRLARARVYGNEDTVPLLKVIYGLLLKSVELERILDCYETPDRGFSFKHAPMCHMWYLLMKVTKRTRYIDDMGPISLGTSSLGWDSLDGTATGACEHSKVVIEVTA